MGYRAVVVGSKGLVPKTTSGKPRRAAARETFLRGYGLEPQHTVLVAGRTDAIVPPGAAEALRALRPGATLTWIPGGHVWGWLMGNRAFADAAVAAMEDRALSSVDALAPRVHGP